MGGRGIHAHPDSMAIRMHDYMFAKDVRETSEKYQAARERHMIEGASTSKTKAKSDLKKRCACCKEWSIPAYTLYMTCPVCGWIDDPNQNANPDLTEGANDVCLHQAQMEWLAQQKKH